MSEIEKLYENARVYDFRYDCNVSFADGDFGCITNCSKGEVKDYCTDKKYFKDAKVIKIKHLYPPFTAEKQISLMAFLINRKVGLSFKAEQGEITVEAISRGLAGIVNRIWQDLTEDEQEQVKGILE